MPGDSFRVKGIILSSEDFKEKDKLVTILTGTHGIIRVCAKGSNKVGSKSSFLSVPFMLCELVISISNGYYYFKDGTIIENNSGIYNSLEAIAAAGHIADSLKESIHQSDNMQDAYELAVYAYYSLANNNSKYSIICSAFNWRLLNILGLAITYTSCDACEEILASGNYILSLDDGTILCSNCARFSKRNNYLTLNGKEVEALNYFANAPLNMLFNVSANEQIVSDLQNFTFRYLSQKFDRNFNALEELSNRLSYNPVRREKR